jgi:hypothetical protein
MLWQRENRRREIKNLLWLLGELLETLMQELLFRWSKS